ncbi:MAG: hypothetical protein V7K57_07580 [Nostoc sp.]
MVGYQHLHFTKVSLLLEHLQPLALNDLSMTPPQVDCSLTEMAVQVVLLK